MMLTTSNDKEIIEFIKDNQEYFFRVAFSYVKNQDQALDIVQEAIVKALQKRYTLRHIEYLKTWFYRILVNECFATIKKSKKLLFLGSYQDFEESLKTKDKYHEEVDAALIIANVVGYGAENNYRVKWKTAILY